MSRYIKLTNKKTYLVGGVAFIFMLLGLFVAYSPEYAVARQSDMSAVRSTYPNISGTSLDGCTLCHTASFGLNSYGRAYRNSGKNFAAVENQDSDGDGFTNIAEITALTLPGDSNSRPSQQPPPAGTVVVAVEGAVNVNVGQEFEVYVIAKDVQADKAVYGVQFELNFDASKLEAIPETLRPSSTMNPYLIARSSVDNGAGKLILAYSRQGDVPGLSGNVTLATVRFRAIAVTAAVNSSTFDVSIQGDDGEDGEGDGEDGGNRDGGNGDNGDGGNRDGGNGDNGNGGNGDGGNGDNGDGGNGDGGNGDNGDGGNGDGGNGDNGDGGNGDGGNGDNGDGGNGDGGNGDNGDGGNGDGGNGDNGDGGNGDGGNGDNGDGGNGDNDNGNDGEDGNGDNDNGNDGEDGENGGGGNGGGSGSTIISLTFQPGSLILGTRDAGIITVGQVRSLNLTIGGNSNPNPNPNPTPTPNPTTATVSGRVNLVNGGSGATITIEGVSLSATTDGGGFFSMANLNYGTYNIKADAYKHLPALCNSKQFSTLTVRLADVTLLGGDFNDDNVIDIADVTAVGVQFGTGNSAVDINGDGVVNVLDLIILANNYQARSSAWGC